MDQRFGSARLCLRVGGGVQRRLQRLGRSARRRPMAGQLRADRAVLGAAAPVGQCPGQSSMRGLPLTGEQPRVNGLGEQRVPEAERANRLVGNQHTALDRLPQRLVEAVRREPGDRAQQPVSHRAAGGRGQLEDRSSVRIKPA
jgi:hypothetical protein